MNGCQKVDDNTFRPSARLSPEINMQNYHEVALIIADYLKSQKDTSSERNLNNLEEWLASSDCIKHVYRSRDLYDSFPPQLSMHLVFTHDQPAKGADLYLYINEDGRLSVASLLIKK